MCLRSFTKGPFELSTYLGSLLRPAALLDVQYKIDGGQKRLESGLKAIEDTSIKEIVKEQLDLGFHAVSDGEYRRHMFWWAKNTGFCSPENGYLTLGNLLPRRR